MRDDKELMFELKFAIFIHCNSFPRNVRLKKETSQFQSRGSLGSLKLEQGSMFGNGWSEAGWKLGRREPMDFCGFKGLR